MTDKCMQVWIFFSLELNWTRRRCACSLKPCMARFFDMSITYSIEVGLGGRGYDEACSS
jgi:hypothetical protein